MRILRLLCLAGLTFCANLAAAGDAVGLFSSVAPRILVVEQRSRAGEVAAQGSGVRTSGKRVVTNCHVLGSSPSSVALRQGNSAWKATVVSRDDERDLCELTANFPDDVKPVVIRRSTTLRVGEEVFAVGAPMGLELTISNGIISSLRTSGPSKVIQTTAAISPGSSGGALFDSSGNLVGITTLQSREGQNLNFAIPSEWIEQISSRSSAVARLVAERDAFSKLAFSVSEKKDWRELERISVKQMSADRSDFEAWYRLIQATAALRALDRASWAMSQMLALPIQSIHDQTKVGIAAFSLGQAFENAERHDDALEHYRNAVLLLPWSEIYGHVYTFVAEREAYAAGESIFKAATEVYPRHPSAWSRLGGTLLSQSKLKSAQQAFGEAVKLDPNDAWAWTGLLFSLSRDGQRSGFDAAWSSMRSTASPETSEKVQSLIKEIGRASRR